jgi:RimJ/RimL family protein N-acetyltransferase
LKARPEAPLLVTEISARNGRSLRAHERVGFTELTRYRDQTDDWVVVTLDLRR